MLHAWYTAQLLIRQEGEVGGTHGGRCTRSLNYSHTFVMQKYLKKKSYPNLSFWKPIAGKKFDIFILPMLNRLLINMPTMYMYT